MAMPSPFDPKSPFGMAMLTADDDEEQRRRQLEGQQQETGRQLTAQPPPSMNRIEDDATAGRRGVTPQSPATEAKGAGFTGGRFDTANMHPFSPQYPLEQRVSQEQAEYKRMTTPPPPMSFLRRLKNTVGDAATAFAGGPQALEAKATLRDRAVARKQQERESLGARISEDTRALSGEQVSEEGQNLRARMAAQAQVAAAQRLGETLSQRTAANREAIQGRQDVADTRTQSQEGIAANRIASQEREAAANRRVRLEIDARDNAVKREIAAMRTAAQNDPTKISPQIMRQAQTAFTIIPQIDRITQETYNVAQSLGPAIGRWNDFWTGKVGAPNPQFANYMADVGYLQSAITIAHSQGRVSNLIFEHFQRMYDAGKQSPENMLEFLKAGKTWMEAYRDAPQQIRQGGMGGGGSQPPANAPTQPGQRITLDQFLKEP